MRVLFIFSGNSASGINPIIENQAKSIRQNGVEVALFPIKGRGMLKYLQNILALRSHLNKNHYHIIHAHYGLTAIIARIATRQRIVVSFMGSDIYESSFWRLFHIATNHILWKAIIVKSAEMKKILRNKKVYIIPNGVDLSRFRPIDRQVARQQLGWDGKIKILFISVFNRNNYSKNFSLAEQSIAIARKSVDLDLISLHDVENEQMPVYYSAADMLLVTSRWEGSPNAVKEAIACNCPVVSTEVGDVKEQLKGLKGSYVCPASAQDIAFRIIQISTNRVRYDYGQRSKAYDANDAAKKIISVYDTCSGGAD
jgi:teichuronic acid biosynthesis glycosyltransferase TuaC